MMDDLEKLITKGIFGAIVITIVLAFGSCQATNYYISEAIKNGSTPIEARCAFEGETSSNSAVLCTQELMRKN